MAKQCKNCGSHVTKRYARVRSYPGEDEPRCCPDCDDMVWGSAGEGAREAKTSAHRTRTARDG